MAEAMHIAEIRLSNFKAHAQLIVKNPGTFTLAVGKNRSGKTSLLDSIEALVKGAGAECIRLGADRAEIRMLIGDKIEATRTINGRGKGKLKVVSDKKFTVNAPAEFLADVLGACSFRPMQFFDLDGPGRKKAVLATVQVQCTDDDWREWGIADDDLADIQELGKGLHPLELVKAVEKTVYDRRAAANKEAKFASQEAAAAKPAGLEQNEPRSLPEINSALTSATFAIADAEAAFNVLIQAQNERARIEARVEALREKAAAATQAARDATVEADSLTGVLAAAPEAQRIDLPALREQHRALQAENAWACVVAEATLAAEAADEIDTTLASIREKAMPTLLARANMPVEGLSIGDSDVLYNEVEASQLSGSERLWLGVQIAKAAAGDAGVICLDGIERLDTEAEAKLVADTKGDGYQYFATRVADGDFQLMDLHAQGATA